MAEGVTHISLPTQEYDRGRQEKTNRRTNTNKLVVTKSRGRYCNTICMCGLSVAWVTSENSTMLLESDILRLFFTGPYLVSSPLCSGFWCWLPLRGSTPTSLFASLLSSLNCPPWSPAATALCPVQLPIPSAGSRRQLSFASPYHFRIRRDFMSKNPLSGFAPKQTIESSALAAYPHSATVCHFRLLAIGIQTLLFRFILMWHIR